MCLEVTKENEVGGQVFALDNLCTGGLFVDDRIFAFVLVVVDRVGC